jgi:hypothetical protein
MAKEEIKEHQLYISSLTVLWRLWKDNRKGLTTKNMWWKILFFTIVSAPFRWTQNLVYRKRIRAIDFKDNAPVFVIGHWRSGTTHLHYLLSKDNQFSYLEAFQAFFFRIALVSKKTMKPLLNRLMPRTRPQDNVAIDAGAPTEEEHPLTNLTHRSSMHSFFFPKNQNYFKRYHLFETSEKSLSRWKKSYKRMLQEIAFYNGTEKTLLLKNPHNTARIKVLKEMFPNAKFIFIHRNPYEVYQSTVHLYKKTIKSQFLQQFSDDKISECVISCYELVMHQYLELKNSIPKNQLTEVSFNELSNKPLSTLERVYSTLNIEGFEKIKPSFESYIQEQKITKKISLKVSQKS